MSFRLQRTRIGVVRGGPSQEYRVSLWTGAAILKILREELAEKYEPFDILVDRQGSWHINGLPREPERALRGIDVAVNAMRGAYGEDGKASRIFESLRVPHTGANPFASALSFNKHATKDFLREHKIPMPYHHTIKKGDFSPSNVFEMFRSVPMPAIVKPVDSGSSFGVLYAGNLKELANAIESAFNFSRMALVEEYIPGVEVTVGVVRGFRNEPFYVLMPTEINRARILTFNDKYIQKVPTRTPARISQKLKEKVLELAKKVHRALDLGAYSKSDFIVHPKRGVMFLEVNSLPALNEGAHFYEGLKAVGATPAQFLDHVITFVKN